ncbi:MAG: hypothetical protein ACE14M_09815, partial [Terriglobales bacterium]
LLYRLLLDYAEALFMKHALRIKKYLLASGFVSHPAGRALLRSGVSARKFIAHLQVLGPAKKREPNSRSHTPALTVYEEQNFAAGFLYGLSVPRMTLLFCPDWGKHTFELAPKAE